MIKKIGFGFLGLLLMACNSEPSLQKYYVNHQEEQDFVVVDVPSSLFLGNQSGLSEKDQKVLKSIKKANVLAYPLTGENLKTYMKQKETIKNILKNDRYKLLMRFGASGKNVRMYYEGDDDAIDEVVVFGYDDEKGFAVARVLGDKMNPSALLKLFQAAGNGDIDINLSGFESIGKMMGASHYKSRRDTTLNVVEQDSLSVVEPDSIQ